MQNAMSREVQTVMANRRDHDSLRQHSSVPGKAARSALRLAVIAMPLLLLVACEMGHNATPTATLTSEEETATATPPTSTPEPTATLSPYEGYLEEDIPACTPIPGAEADPCDATVPKFIEGGGAGSPPLFGDKPADLNDSLSLDKYKTWLPHLVLRGTYVPDTVRCTLGDRWRIPSYVPPEEIGEQEEISIIAEIGCYADVRVNEYIIGKGPEAMTVQVFFAAYDDSTYEETVAFIEAELEWYEDAEELSENWGFDVTSEDAIRQDLKEYAESIEELRASYERTIGQEHMYQVGNLFGGFSGGIDGREMILFVGPPLDHSKQVWQVHESWDVQRRADGTVIAVHPQRAAWQLFNADNFAANQSALEIELSRFKQLVLSAHKARVAEYDGRIGADMSFPELMTDIHGLRGFMTNVGTYDHADGTPVAPPPVPGE